MKRLKKKEEEAAKFEAAMKKALLLYRMARIDEGRGRPFQSIRSICAQVNLSDMQGVKRQITRTTLQRYYNKQEVKPLPRRPKSKIPEELFNTLDYHISMMQVSFFYASLIY